MVLATLLSKRSFHKLLFTAFLSLNANRRLLDKARDSWPNPPILHLCLRIAIRIKEVFPGIRLAKLFRPRL